MTAFGFACLIAVFPFTALVSMVTGGTSLITVRAILQQAWGWPNGHHSATFIAR
jgi:hypothetical protein